MKLHSSNQKLKQDLAAQKCGLNGGKPPHLSASKQVFQVAFDEGISPFKDINIKFMENLVLKNTVLYWGNKL